MRPDNSADAVFHHGLHKTLQQQLVWWISHSAAVCVHAAYTNAALARCLHSLLHLDGCPATASLYTVAATINEEFKLELDINSASKERRRGALSLSGTNGSRVDQEGSSAFPK